MVDNTTKCVMSQALSLQAEAAKVGFDWPEASPIYAKIAEELSEVREADDAVKRIDEIGDLLFACINLARHFDVDPAIALKNANAKFIRRLQYIKTRLAATDQSMSQVSLDTLDKLWDAAKQQGL